MRPWIEPEVAQKTLQFAYLVLAESGQRRRSDQPQAYADDKPAQDHPLAPKAFLGIAIGLSGLLQ